MAASFRKRLQRTFLALAAPLSLSAFSPEAGAQAIPTNAQDPVGIGGSPTFTNTSAGWSYSVFNPGSSIYPFTPFTNPACVAGTGATGCGNQNFVFDNTKVVFAGNASVDPSGNLNPITTVDKINTLPTLNEPYKPTFVPDGPSNDGWVFGYVFGPTDTTTNSYGGGKVGYLGFYSPDGEIKVPHTVTLWELYTGTDPVANPPVALASVQVPSGTCGGSNVYSDTFCWVQLGTPVTLVDNQFYVVGAYGGYNPPTPAPIPLIGAAAAFGFSRKMRQRIGSGVQAL